MDLDALQAVLGMPRLLKPLALGMLVGPDRVMIDMLNPIDADKRSAIWACGLLPSDQIDPNTIGACCSAVENEDGSWTVTNVCRLHETVLNLG